MKQAVVIQELRELYREAFYHLNNVPSFEKQRCIDVLANYMIANRPAEEIKAFKQRSFEVQWKVCMVRIIQNVTPFKGYNAELAISCK